MSENYSLSHLIFDLCLLSSPYRCLTISGALKLVLAAYLTITTSSLVLFAMPWVQQHLFPLRVSSASDDIILTPKLINPNAVDAAKDIEEFRLNSKVYIWCRALIKPVLYIKQRTSPIWKWGEDIIEKGGDQSKQYYYCYLYKR